VRESSSFPAPARVRPTTGLLIVNELVARIAEQERGGNGGDMRDE
jgi:hypothetical protein